MTAMAGGRSIEVAAEAGFTVLLLHFEISKGFLFASNCKFQMLVLRYSTAIAQRFGLKLNRRNFYNNVANKKVVLSCSKS